MTLPALCLQSRFEARWLYGAFVLAAAAPGRRQLPLAPAGELASGCTLIFMPPNSNSNGLEPMRYSKQLATYTAT